MRLSTHVSLVLLRTGRGPGLLHSRRNRNCQICQLDSKWLGAQWRASASGPDFELKNHPAASSGRRRSRLRSRLRLGTAHRPGATATGPGLTGRLGPGPWTPRACHPAWRSVHCWRLRVGPIAGRPVPQICLHWGPLGAATGASAPASLSDAAKPEDSRADRDRGGQAACHRPRAGSLGVWALNRPETVASPSNPRDWCDPSCLRPVNTWTDFKFCRAKYGLSTIWYNKLKRYDTMDNMNNNKIQ